jgi:hypothetical protein
MGEDDTPAVPPILIFKQQPYAPLGNVDFIYLILYIILCSAFYFNLFSFVYVTTKAKRLKCYYALLVATSSSSYNNAND